MDEYADGMQELRNFIVDTFSTVRITAATGRHYALLANKSKDVDINTVVGSHAVLEDSRFRDDGSYAIDDTHLKPWESKQLDGDTV